MSPQSFLLKAEFWRDFKVDKLTNMTSRHGSLSSVAFQKTMQDLIKGMRSNKENTSEFISLCISEIKQEVTSTDPFTKAEAVSICLSNCLGVRYSALFSVIS